jgi:hypothetical protein
MWKIRGTFAMFKSYWVMSRGSTLHRRNLAATLYEEKKDALLRKYISHADPVVASYALRSLLLSSEAVPTNIVEIATNICSQLNNEIHEQPELEDTLGLLYHRHPSVAFTVIKACKFEKIRPRLVCRLTLKGKDPDSIAICEEAFERDPSTEAVEGFLDQDRLEVILKTYQKRTTLITRHLYDLVRIRLLLSDQVFFLIHAIHNDFVIPSAEFISKVRPSVQLTDESEANLYLDKLRRELANSHDSFPDEILYLVRYWPEQIVVRKWIQRGTHEMYASGDVISISDIKLLVR